jgi:hypothetical protein
MLGIETPAQAWRHVATALRKTANDFKNDLGQMSEFERGLVYASEASAQVFDALASVAEDEAQA